MKSNYFPAPLLSPFSPRAQLYAPRTVRADYFVGIHCFRSTLTLCESFCLHSLKQVIDNETQTGGRYPRNGNSRKHIVPGPREDTFNK